MGILYICPFHVTYICWHNREQWCISAKPCGLKLGSLDRRCFPEILPERRDCFEKYNWMSVSKNCRAHDHFMGIFVQMDFKCRGNTNILLIIEGICSFRNLFSLLWTVEEIGCDFLTIQLLSILFTQNYRWTVAPVPVFVKKIQIWNFLSIARNLNDSLTFYCTGIINSLWIILRPLELKCLHLKN